VLCKWLIDG